MSAATCIARRGRHASGGLAVMVTALCGLAGCQSVGSLSTAASMLVEVDVYKGPLGSAKTVQLGELAAIFDQADHKLGLFVRDARVKGRCDEKGHAAGSNPDDIDKIDRQQLCDALLHADRLRKRLSAFPVLPPDAEDPRREGLKKLNKAAAQVIEYQTVAAATGSAASAAAAAAVTAASLAAPASSEPMTLAAAADTINLAAMEASRLATELKVEAFYWSESQIGRVTANPVVRSMLVGYVNLASELANQISARTVAIAKQLDLNVAGNTLALSDHLKEAGPSDFLHLYDWYAATLEDPLNAWPAKLSAADRARLAKRLFSDHYWTRINQVHASGQGEVRMVLIKDDIGNWNLKSFDNDAEQLLGAYRNLTLAGIDAGIRLAKDVASGGGAAGLELASQFARGRLGSTERSTLSAQRIDAMRASVAARLDKIRADAAEEDARQKGLEDGAKNALGDSQKATTDAQGKVAAAAPDALPVAQQRLADARAQEALAADRHATAQAERREKMAVALENARREIEVHRRVIDSLKEFQVTSPTTPTTLRTLSNAMQP